MQITFLSASIPLTKTYTKLPDGSVEKSSYPNVWEVSTCYENVSTLGELKEKIDAHAALGHCLLKGNTLRPLVNESRKDSTDRSAATDFICLDFDGIEPSVNRVNEDGVSVPTTVTVDYILNAMGLGDVSYILQWSGSMGIGSNQLRCHVFIMLTQPMPAPVIKQWLIQKNHEVHILREHQALTRTGCALTWGLDITACQSDKLIYIAPPIIKGMKNPLGAKPRISVVEKPHTTFSLHTISINSSDKNKQLTETRIAQLREKADLPKRKLTYKHVGNHEVLAKPGECTVTGMKVDRGFVYLNLDGGDSWGYFHPENNPDYIFNFKGEPTYLTKELVPAYWETLQTQAYRVTSTGVIHLAFLDRLTSTYYRGTYNPDQDLLDILPAKNETMLRHYAEANGLRLGNVIPEWSIAFNPLNPERVDFEARTINTFERTSYMKQVIKRVATCPPKIFSIINHVMANDAKAIDHFINWLACIAQNLNRTRTAWVLTGSQGTGKGVLFERVLAPIFGPNQTIIKRSAELNERWTDFTENKFIVFIDEIQTSALQDEAGVIATLKSLITNPTIQVRALYRAAYSVSNYTNWLFASNQSDPVTVPKNDRRFNVSPYQSKPFPKPTDEWLDSLEAELAAFFNYLMSYEVDKERAATPLENEARDNLIQLSQTTAESTASAIQEGDFTYFIDQLPTDNTHRYSIQDQEKIDKYRRTLYDLLTRTRADGACNLSRDELFNIFDYTVGGMNKSPTSFAKYLGHRQIYVKSVAIHGRTVRGIQTEWKNPESFPTLVATHFNDIHTALSTIKKAKATT